MKNTRNIARTLAMDGKSAQRQAALVQRRVENSLARFLQSLDRNGFEFTRNQKNCLAIGLKKTTNL